MESRHHFVQRLLHAREGSNHGVCNNSFSPCIILVRQGLLWSPLYTEEAEAQRRWEPAAQPQGGRSRGGLHPLVVSFWSLHAPLCSTFTPRVHAPRSRSVLSHRVNKTDRHVVLLSAAFTVGSLPLHVPPASHWSSCLPP